jgi:hypothetical protein
MGLLAQHRYFTRSLKFGDDAVFMAFSNQSKTLIRLGFPATFEVGVRDRLLRVSFCRLASTGGSLR